MKIRRRRGGGNIRESLREICLQPMLNYTCSQQAKWIICSFMVICLVIFVVFWKTKPDPCHGKQILENLCEEFRKQEVSGRLCYSLCVEKTYDLSNCIHNDQNVKSFLVADNLLLRASVDLLEPKTLLKLPEGLSVESFSKQTTTYLHSILGHSKSSLNFQYMNNKLLQFADFNENELLSLGEVQSLWRLINIEEFLLLFLFRNQPALPNLNATCGSLYGFQYHSTDILYNADKRHFPSSFFKNYYRWGLGSWYHRVKVVVGMLGLVDDLAEIEGVTFYLCNTEPAVLGYTDQHELILRDLTKLKSAKILNDILTNKTCVDDKDCVYTKQCQSSCDRRTGLCTGKITQPTLWFVCDIVHKYLLFDAPFHIYYDLKHYLDKCLDVQPGMMNFSTFLEDFRTFLWDLIKIGRETT